MGGDSAGGGPEASGLDGGSASLPSNGSAGRITKHVGTKASVASPRLRLGRNGGSRQGRAPAQCLSNSSEPRYIV